MANQILNIVNEKLVQANIVLQIKDSSVFNLIRQDEDISTLAGQIGDTILNEIAYIRNKQKPVYDSYIKCVKDQLQASQALSELSDYMVASTKCSDTLKMFGEKGVLPSGIKAITSDGNIELHFETPTDEDIRLAFSFQENAELKIMAEKVVSQFSLTELKEIFAEYAAEPDSHSPAYSPTRESLLKKNTDRILLGYIAVRNLLINKPSIHAGVDNRLYTNTMQYYVDNLANQLVSVLNDNRGRIERRQLVVVGRPEDKEIIVQDEVYNEFISNGGSVEVLFGMLVTGDVNGPERLLESVQAKADVYLKAWHDKVNVTRLANAQNEIGRYKVAYSIAMSKLIENEMSEDIIKILPATKNEIIKSTDEILSVLSQDTITNIGKTAQILISKLIFPNSKFEEFTTNMIKAGETVPDINSNDAASFASIKMLIGYLLEQVTTTEY